MEKNGKRVMVNAIMFIIHTIRSIFLLPHGTCRFVPSCSQYTLETLMAYSFPKAVCLIVIRIVKCNPLCKGGFDPVTQGKK